MDLLKLRKKLLTVARSNPPGDHVPYAFEQRILARLAALPKADDWAWWGRALWRGAAACAAVALLFSAWSFSREQSTANVDLEDTVVASVNEAEMSW